VFLLAPTLAGFVCVVDSEETSRRAMLNALVLIREGIIEP